jgi:RimJ/RimL family protein N-acetyltransferase
LGLIEKVAFSEIRLHKIFTYAYDLRPRLYDALDRTGFTKEATLKEHCLFDNNYIDVVIHSKTNRYCKLRLATKHDLEKTFQWANTPEVRSFSYNQREIDFLEHSNWFKNRISSKDCEYYILENNSEAIGSIRFDIEDKVKAKISYLIDPKYFRMGFGTKILSEGERKLIKERPEVEIIFGFVLKENLASKHIFEKLKYFGVQNPKEIKYEKIL